MPMLTHVTNTTATFKADVKDFRRSYASFGARAKRDLLMDCDIG